MKSLRVGLLGFALVAGCVPAKTPARAFLTAPKNAQPTGPKLHERTENQSLLAPPPIQLETLTPLQAWDGRVLAVDAPIVFDPDKGQVMGFLRKGTVVMLGSDTKRPDWLPVETGFPRVEASGGFARRPSNTLQAWIPRAMPQGSSQVEQACPAKMDTVVVRYGLFRELLLAPGGEPFSYVKCGKLRLGEKDATLKYVRVAAEFPAGELFGWMEIPETNEPDYDCAAGMLFGEHGTPRIPLGYRHAPGKLEEFMQFVRKQGTIYWGNGPAKHQCSQWQFQPNGPYQGQLVRHKSNLPLGTRKETVQYSFNKKEPLILLACPEVTTADWTMTNGCVWDYAVVQFNQQRIDLIRWSRSTRQHDEYDSTQLVAYRPDKVLSWYLTREHCEQAKGLDPEPWPRSSVSLMKQESDVDP